MGYKIYVRIFFIVLIIAAFYKFSSASPKDFDLSDSIVDIEDFMSGGPAKDGIPALTDPKLLDAEEADFLKDKDIVVGLVIDDVARAYPLKILNWHEIVNDQISDVPVAVTWCPLTRSVVTFDRRLGGKTLEFGVSGLLYNSNVVMYDRNDDGLWSQLQTEGLTGKHAAESLKVIPSYVTTWQEWKVQHPETLVLSKNTGHWRDYNRNPYKDYHDNSIIMFPTKVTDTRLPLKSMVIGVKVESVAKAYPLTVIKGPLKDTISGVDVEIEPVEGGSAVIKDKDGNFLPSIVTYWFAWSTFNKDTLIYGQ